jgi:hypothetical protein
MKISHGRIRSLLAKPRTQTVGDPYLHTSRDAAGAAAAADAPRIEYRVVNVAPSDRHTLDRALEETFPASDPVSIMISEVVRVKPTRPGLN